MAEDYRAILTDREKEIIAGSADVSDSYRYRVVTRVRKKIERLGRDLELLDEHHDTLGDELREAVDADGAAITQGDGADGAITAADETADESPADPDKSEPVRAEDDLTAAVERVADDWEGTSEKLEARRQAAQAVLEYVRENGTVSQKEAKQEVYPENPVPNQNEKTWYEKNIRPVLNEVAKYDNSERAYVLELEEDE